MQFTTPRLLILFYQRFNLRLIPAFLLVPVLFLIPVWTLAQCPVLVDAGPDQFICNPPNPVSLDGDIQGPYLNFMWMPTTGMSNANTLNPTVNVNQNTTYVLKVRAVDVGNDLIVNGDFEGGNTGFTTDYTYNPGFTLPPFGSYEVTGSPAIFPDCPDHTSGSGSYMVVDGSDVPGKLVWCETVSVMPNTDYSFTAWALSFTVGGPFASLKFTINGTQVGSNLAVNAPQCFWHSFSSTWNSGSNTSATLCIENLTVAGANNDFAIDDIAFNPICTQTDTVKVQVLNIQAVSNPAVLNLACPGATVMLNGAGSSTGANVSYLWETSDGNIVSGETTLTPIVDQAGTYTLTVSADYGNGQCTKTASSTVILNPNPLNVSIQPPLPLGCNGNSVNLVAQSNQGAVSYAWTSTNGNIISGANSAIATVNQAGLYLLTVTNIINGCTATAQTTVIVGNNPPTAMASASGIITCVTPISNLSAQGSSFGPNIQYNWSSPNGVLLSGQNAANAVAGSGGLYILKVSNTSNGCIALDTVLVSADTAQPTIQFLPVGTLNCLEDTIVIQANVVPVNANFSWTVSPSSPLITVAGSPNIVYAIAPANYTLLVTNPINGCTQTKSVSVGIDIQAPVALASASDTLSCSKPTAQIQGTGSSAGSNITYHWTSTSGNIVLGADSITALVNAPGVYVLTVRNTQNGCTDTASVQVIADANLIVAVANAEDSLDCIVKNVNLNSNGSSNLPGLLYAWSVAPGSSGHFTSSLDTSIASVDAPGIYQLVLTNPASGCTAVDFAVVGLDTMAPQAIIAPPDTITCLQPKLKLSAFNADSIGSYTYLWTASGGGSISNGVNSLMPEVNSAGVYTLNIFNTKNGCTAQVSTIVPIATGVPIISLQAPAVLNCALDSLKLTSNGSSLGPEYIYAWTSSPGGNIRSGANEPEPLVDEPAWYTLVITNNLNGCFAQDSILVLKDTLAPPANAGPNQTLTCFNPVLSLTANQGVGVGLNYQWSTIGGVLPSQSTGQTLPVDTAGQYIVKVSNPINACFAFDTVLVVSNQKAPVFTISPPGILNCSNTDVTLNSTPPLPSVAINWTTPNSNIVSGSNTNHPTINAPGIIIVNYIDFGTGCAAKDTVLVSSDYNQPVAAVPDTLKLTCQYPVLQIAGFTNIADPLFNWSTPNGHLLTGSDLQVVSVDKGGIYYFTVTDSSSMCTATDSVYVLDQSQKPQVFAGFDAILTCSFPTITLHGMTGLNGVPTYHWSTVGSGHFIGNTDQSSVLVDAPGVYVFSVLDTVSQCSNSDTVQVFLDTLHPVALISNTQLITCVNKQINLFAIGNNPPGVSYQWSASNGGNISIGPNTSSPLVDAPGTYQLLVTNPANGCTATASVNVQETLNPPQVGIDAAPPITCTNSTVILNGTPASGNYTYSWQTMDGNISSGGNTKSATVSKPGTYQLVVTNAQTGCKDSAQVQVAIDTVAPVFNFVPAATLTCSTPKVNLTAQVISPTGGAFSAFWKSINGQLSAPPNQLSSSAVKPGLYSLSIRSTLNGCQTTDTLLVDQNIIPPVANAGTAILLNCTFTSADLNASNSTGQGVLSYIWSTLNGKILSNAASATPIIVSPGTYVVQVTDGLNGCTDTAQIQVNADTTRPVVNIMPALPITCVRDTANLSGLGSDQGANFIPSWTDVQGNVLPNQTGLKATVSDTGLYMLTIVNQTNGCATSDTMSVLLDQMPPDANAGPPQLLYCTQKQVALNGSSNTGPNMQFQWSTVNGHFVSGEDTGIPIVDSAGTYVVTVTNPANGCTKVSNTTVTTVDLPNFTLNVVQPSCADPRAFITFETVSGGVGPYTYAIDGGVVFKTSKFFDEIEPTTYYPVVRDQFGCTSFQTVVIEEPKFPSVKLEEFTLIEIGTGYTILPVVSPGIDSIESVQWTNSATLSCSNCLNPIASPLETTPYVLTITDIFGCTASDRIQIRVNPSRFTYSPNIITPNGDNENDYFTLYGRNVDEIELLQIFNRWGGMVFENTNFPFNVPQEGWDGRVKGEPPVPGVYVWTARIRYSDGVIKWLKGDVTVYR